MKRRVRRGVVVLAGVLAALGAGEAAGQADPCLVGWWKLDEGSGTTAADTAGGHDGVLVGDPCWAGGVDGRALAFDGVEDGVHVGHDEDLNLGTGPFTLAAWIRNEDTPGSNWKRIITKRGHAASPAYYSLCLSGNKLALELTDYNSSGYGIFYAPLEIQGDGHWHHVAAVRNELNEVYLYIDGDPCQVGNATQNVSNSGILEIGIFQDTGETFTGRIDDVRIYKSVLSLGQIRQLAGWAITPTPDHEATGVSVETELSFIPSPVAASHDVYFDTVNPPVRLLADASTETTFDPCTIPLEYGQTYYWRVDENTSTKTLPGEVWQFTTFPWPGGGVEVNPYRIGTARQLQLLAESSEYWGGSLYFKLVDDIVILPGIILHPIGNSTASFSGVFDGGGHTISGLVQNGDSFLGLFGNTNSSAQIRKLGVTAATINGSGDYLGILVGNNYGHISHCYVTGSITGGDGSYKVGGLVGQNRGTISRCHAAGAISGGDNSYDIGGLVGFNYETITECSAGGTVNGDHCMGGLVGYNWGTINKCSATGRVNGTSTLGGLVGMIYQSTINHCYAGGVVSGASYANHLGGLVGQLYEGSINHCYAASTVTGGDGSNVIGGLVGAFYGGTDEISTISHCYAAGVVSGAGSLGGLVGKHYSGSISISSSYWDKDATGQATSAGGGEDKTTVEMKRQGTFVGWDFVNTWRIIENQSYPYQNTSAGPADPRSGDVNGDGVVNLEDFMLLCEHWLEWD